MGGRLWWEHHWAVVSPASLLQHYDHPWETVSPAGLRFKVQGLGHSSIGTRGELVGKQPQALVRKHDWAAVSLHFGARSRSYSCARLPELDAIDIEVTKSQLIV